MKLFLFVFVLVTSSLLAQPQRPKPAASPLVAKGVDAYRRAQFGEAATLFRQAVAANPSDLTARLYLGLTCLAQFRPGDPAPASIAAGKQAELEFRNLLDFDPENKSALNAMGSLTLMQAMASKEPAERKRRFEEAAEWFKTLSEVDVWNAPALYNFGTATWQLMEPEVNAARSAAQPPQPEGERLKDDATRAALNRKYLKMINDAIEALDRSIGLDPNYVASRTQLITFYRLRASLTTDETARQKDLTEAQKLEKRSDVKSQGPS